MYFKVRYKLRHHIYYDEWQDLFDTEDNAKDAVTALLKIPGVDDANYEAA